MFGSLFSFTRNFYYAEKVLSFFGVNTDELMKPFKEAIADVKKEGLSNAKDILTGEKTASEAFESMTETATDAAKSATEAAGLGAEAGANAASSTFANTDEMTAAKRDDEQWTETQPQTEAEKAAAKGAQADAVLGVEDITANMESLETTSPSVG